MKRNKAVYCLTDNHVVPIPNERNVDDEQTINHRIHMGKFTPLEDFSEIENSFRRPSQFRFGTGGFVTYPLLVFYNIGCTGTCSEAQRN